MKLAEKTALITGSAVRLGRAMALGLAGEGVNVAIHYRSSPDEAEQTAKEARALGVRAETFRANLADPGEVDALAAAVSERLGLAHILINNASIFDRMGVEETTVDALRLNQSIHVEAPLLLSRWLYDQLRDGAEGAIVNMLDHRAFDLDASRLPYSVSKAGLAGLTPALAREFAPRVRVNGIAPGPILPPPELDSKEGRKYLESVASEVPLERVGSVECIVEACLFLIQAPYTTGAVLPFDGGRHLL